MSLVRYLDYCAIQHEMDNAASRFLHVVTGMSGALKSLLWVQIAVFTVVYVGAIMACVHFRLLKSDFNDYYAKTGWDYETYFSSVPMAMFTMFKLFTLDGWANDVVRHLIEVSPAMRWIAPLYVITTSYLCGFFIIGVVVESVIS